MRILLTAFEPFDGTCRNSSAEACRLLLEAGVPGVDVRFALLPVAYDADTRAVEAALAAAPCDVLLHTGQAAGSPAVRVERLAVNVRYATEAFPPDPTAPQPPIEPEGPPAYAATVPVDPLVDAIRAAGVPAVVSNHAGVYLCNHVFYRSLHRAAQSAGLAPRVAFLHLPALPGQHADPVPSLPAEQLTEAIRAALAAVR